MKTAEIEAIIKKHAHLELYKAPWDDVEVTRVDMLKLMQQYLAAARFKVTDAFIRAVQDRHPSATGSGCEYQAVIDQLFEEVES